MAFLKNAWYVASWSDALKPGELLPRKILGEDVLLLRDSKGQVAAMQDRCPHRFIPLHMGRIVEDTVECCYHGLRFDCSGRCVLNPHGDGKIPAAARVRTYPLVERHSIVWIWMGDQEANPERIPDYGVLDSDSGFMTTRGDILMQSNYILMGENLLDLSHVAFLHKGLLGSDQMVKTLPSVREESGHLHVDRLMKDVDVPSVFNMIFRNDGKPVDAWQNMRWTPPSCYLLDVGVTAPGHSRDDGAWFFGIHLLTPETESTTHYHFASARPPGSVVDPDLDAELARCRRIAFADQDKPVVEAQQRVVGTQEFWSMKPVLLPVDAGPVRMRRSMERLIAEESKGVDA
ncbi:aromatic ring-hydroxylating dioxygenase subunit alpha (plasmid) [Variovorax sp. V59]|uniref:aromatic ring-hydroxylating dioxygenase subunit alpha n=1 Tax=unclassified Variovorax TaxID=663243 RepID=UPI0034E83D36